MKRMMNATLLLTAVGASSFAFGQGMEGVSYAKGLLAIGAALAIGMGALGAAGGQGRAASSAFEGIARNPGAKNEMFTPFILGLVFMEFQALLSFVIAYMLLDKM